MQTSVVLSSFSQPELSGGVVKRSLHQCGPLSYALHILSGCQCPAISNMKERKKDYAVQVAACIKERSPVLKGRAPPHTPRGRGCTEVYTSKLASTMGPTTR
eukprot:774360-Pelagomonas_calceolata.AAC.1